MRLVARSTHVLSLDPVENCALLLVVLQAGLAFDVGYIDRQMLLNNVIARLKQSHVAASMAAC
jgi:hypothetical protein